MTNDAGRTTRTADLVRAEYQEIPGLSLTLPQARRMWGLEEPVVASLFEALVETGFLRLTPSGTYVRSTSH